MMSEKPPPPCRGDFAFVHRLRVRWSEVDAQGIVFNPNYLVYCDIGLNEYMRGVGFPYPEGLAAFGTDLFAVNANVNFRLSARFDDEVDVAVRVSQIGRTSLRFHMAVFRDDVPLFDALMTYVNAARETQARAPCRSRSSIISSLSRPFRQ